MISLRRTAMFVFMITFSLLQCAADETKPLFPGKEWKTASPADVGLDENKLAEMPKFMDGCGCIVRRGLMVYAWGDPAARIDIASAVKPWYTHFLMKALENGKIKSLDDKIDAWEPRLNDLNPALDHKDRLITWKHLANQISCYGVKEKPGEAYDYSDFNMALFFDALFLKVYGSSWEKVDEEVLHPLLTDLLQCQDNPTFMGFGDDRPGRMRISLRDLARFGLLYLHKGNWNGKPLVDEKLAAMAIASPLPNSIPRTKGESAEMIEGQRSIGGGNNQCDHAGSYSFAWWINGVGREGKRHWPDAPTDAFGAFGHGGIRVCVIFPSQDSIVCWNEANIEGSEQENYAMRLLMESILPEKN
ncbi:MAG: serine hydrolase [Candidatus Omnitrophota bacterium]